MKRLTLKTPQDVRRALARVSNMLLNNEIDPKTANAIIYACNSILQSIRVDEQERKIEELANLVDQFVED
ncbi:hypothetical protein [Eubacterium sp.]|uniref:hypothetical protein n=1 Tax=Eubacterium sp. TaxID=142586 RepID=UPI002FC61840